MQIQIGETVREMTATELENYQNILASIEAEKQKQLEKEQARASALAKLETLGLTAAEIAALVG